MSRARWLIVALVSGSIVLLLSCSLGAVAMQQGVVAPPDIQLAFGDVRLVSGTSIVPDCARLITSACRDLHPEPVVWTYTIWLLWQHNPRSQENTQLLRLFSTRIKHQ